MRRVADADADADDGLVEGPVTHARNRRLEAGT
jgi:hypothetical protein